MIVLSGNDGFERSALEGNNPQRLAAIDALRGIAAAYIVIYHMVLIPTPHLAVPDWASKVILGGGTAVTLFFLLSAFSLSYAMPSVLRQDYPNVSFFCRRFFRIAPLFYAMLIFHWVFHYYAFNVAHSFTKVFSGVFFIFNLIPGMQEGYVWASSTIGIEMIFYVFFPIIYARCHNIWSGLVWLMASLLLFLVMQNSNLYMSIPDADIKSYLQLSAIRHFPQFICGIVVFMIARTLMNSRDFAQYRSAGFFLILAAVYIYAAYLNGWVAQLFSDTYYWQGVIYGLLIIGCLLNPISFIVNRTTLYLGKLSYSIYLLHPVFVYILIPTYLKIYAWSPNTTIAIFICYFTTLGLVVAASSVTYALIEKPGIELGKRVYHWLSTTMEARARERELIAAR